LWMQKDAAGNANSLVLNRSGTIETYDGDITINTGRFKNSYFDFQVDKVITLAEGNNEGSLLTPEPLTDYVTFIVEGGIEYLLISKSNWSTPILEYHYQLGDSETITVNTVGNAGRIASGHDLNIFATSLENQASTLLAGRDITLIGNQLNNQGYQTGTSVLEKIYTRDFAEDRSFAYVHRLREIKYSTPSGPLYQAIIQASSNLYASFDNDISNTTTVANAGNISHSLQAPTLSGFGDLSLPSGLNGLFITSQDPNSPYLITTNRKLDGLGGLDYGLFNNLYSMLGMRPGSAPYETDSRFTDKNRFIGSAYFLERLNLRPDYDYRFLGDAAFDTRYISDAMLRQTGSRYINGVGSDLSQMQYLIDNAAQAYGSLGLTFGVSLTAEQIARLDKSIVWWEPMTIQGQTVLAPKLYLAKNDVTAVSGSVIKGGNVELEAGRLINSNGSLLADNSLFIDSWSTIDNINAGQIKAGGFLGMTAMGDINNIGSSIRGQQVALDSIDGSIINRTETQQWSVSGQNGRKQILAFSQTDVGDIASIQSEGSMSLNAGKNIELTASEITTEKGPLTLSAGQDISILTAQQSQSTQVGKNKTEAQGALSSSLDSGGNLNVFAGRDINAKAAGITAEDSVALVAGRDVNLTTAESREYQETYGKRKKEINES
ncbi:hemagglutinin repeat-containing protein, partial [Jinshanibacter sp. LJY008]